MNQLFISYQEQLLLALGDPVEAAAYLNASIEEQSPELLLLALHNITEAHGICLPTDEQTFTLSALLSRFGLKLAVEVQQPLPALA